MDQIGHLRVRKDKRGVLRYQMIVEVWRNGKKYYKSKTFATEKEAQRWANKIRYEIDQGIVTKELLKNRKLSHALEKYVTEVLPHKPRNARNVKHHLMWWDHQLGNLQLTEVTPMVVGECRDKLLKEPTYQGKQRASATVVRYISSLSAVLETAIKEWHWIEKNPVKMIRKPTVSNARTRFLTEDECKRLLSACKLSRNPYLYSIVVLALCTGMRRGEILGLKWKDIDFDNRFIVLSHTKNGTSRHVPMVEAPYQILKNLYKNEPTIDFSYNVFPSLNLERYLDIRTAWLFALKRANIKDFRFHDLRHSCASYLGMSGASDREIGEILGHKDLRSSQRYTHLTRKHLAEKLERANQQFIGNEV